MMLSSPAPIPKNLTENECSEQLLEKAIELVETLNMPTGMAADHPISHVLRLSDLTAFLATSFMEEL